MKDVGWELKPGESDGQKALRARVFYALGYDARDPERWPRRATLQKKLWTTPRP